MDCYMLMIKRTMAELKNYVRFHDEALTDSHFKDLATMIVDWILHIQQHHGKEKSSKMTIERDETTRAIYDALCKIPFEQFKEAVHEDGDSKMEALASYVFQKIENQINTNPVYVHPLDDLSKRIHQANQKWWIDLNTGQPLQRNVGELLMLTISELAEAGEDSPQYFTILMRLVQHISKAMEGHRKNKMDDKLPQYKMFNVEIVDAIIRLLDIAGSEQTGFPIGEIFEAKMAFNAVREDHSAEHRKSEHGKKY